MNLLNELDVKCTETFLVDQPVGNERILIDIADLAARLSFPSFPFFYFFLYNLRFNATSLSAERYSYSGILHKLKETLWTPSSYPSKRQVRDPITMFRIHLPHPDVAG